MHVLDIIMVPLQIFIILFSWYYFIVGFFGLWHRKEKKNIDPKNRFALFILAHNEEKVISQLIKNLQALNYPNYLYDIYVVADNCTDKTAQIIKETGIKVFERFNTNKRGKGYALEWLLKKMAKIDKEYNGICVFDADNFVHPDFLLVMNNRLSRGEKVIQGFIDSKNPNDTWISANFSMMFWVVNHVWHLAKYNMGLSCCLGGTGMCISYDLLKKIGWETTCLVEDMEFTMKAMLIGCKTTWAHEAIVYDEKPLTFIQSWRQRKRWLQGQFDVAFRYIPKIIKSGIKKFDIRLLEIITILLQPLFLISSTIFMIISQVTIKYTFILHYLLPLSLQQMFTYVQYIIMTYILIRMRAKGKIWYYLPFYPVFMLSWIPIAFIGLFHHRNSKWVHTEHSRALNYKDFLTDKNIIVKIKKRK